MHTIRRSIVYKCGWFEACDEIEEIFSILLSVACVGTREPGTSVLPQRRRERENGILCRIWWLFHVSLAEIVMQLCMLYYWEVFGYVCVCISIALVLFVCVLS